MRDRGFRRLEAFCAAVVLLAITSATWSAHAQDVSARYEAMSGTVREFAVGFSEGNAARVEAVASEALWRRLRPRFVDAQPGSFGRVEVVQVGQSINRLDYTTALLLWVHPDGVEDVVTVTLKLTGDAWKVCGGPCGASPAQ